MKKLLKDYGFQYEHQYFDMCLDSYINGQRAQAQRQFEALQKKDKKVMLNYLLGELTGNQSEIFTIIKFFINCF